MNLEQWCELDERIYVAESDERYRQYAGLKHSIKTIERLAEAKSLSATLFLENFSEPRELFLTAVENIADSSTKKLELKLYELRNTKIVSKQKFDGRPVNWSSWRQYNSAERDPKKRKAVFDEFVKKTRFISPVIKERFDTVAAVYKKHAKGTSPLDGYLENEKFSYSQLIEFVKSMGAQAKAPFRDALADVSKKVLDRPAEYYDDFYFFRNRVYADLEKNFAGVDPAAQVKRTLVDLGFDLSRINIDTENRKDKYPSPICFFVQVPTDIRVLYKSESPYFDLQGCYHEMGHAAHATSIDPAAPYHDRYGFSMGIAEIFSIFLERLTKNKRYLKSLGITDGRVLDELVQRNNFMELFFVTFYAANSLMKAQFWKKKLTVPQASGLYGKLIKEYTGLAMPGEYWMLHHILPDAIMYVPSYIIAAVRAAELEKHLQGKFGEDWWTQRGAGDEIREFMRPGAKIDLARFSRMDASLFVKEITGA
ncbi:hypothetical protein [Candidatus Nitrososphaera sp. FF02]|uniref:hypothetical protein n=1 Tax=Candidatus Nitrososphaera sp. FF02 TaxID=3398226 RepID=UPI0039ED240E